MIKNLIKLVTFIFILSTKNISTFGMDLGYESKVDAENKTLDEKESAESSAEKIAQINAYRSKRLEECGLYKDINGLVQEYDPIEDKWECEKTLIAHTNHVDALCVLPGNKLASGSSTDRTLKIWDLETGKFEKILLNDRSIDAIALCSFENKLIFGGYHDGSIKIFDIETGKCEKILKGHEYFVRTLCLLPGNKLASGGSDCNIKIWNLKSGKCEKTLKGNIDAVYLLYLSSKDELTSITLDCEMKIWDLKTSKCKKTLANQQLLVSYSLPLNKKAYIVLIGSSILTIFDSKTKKALFLSDQTTSLCLLSNNKLASGHIDGTIKIWSNPVLFHNVPSDEFYV